MSVKLVNKADHIGRTWSRPANYFFASSETVAALAAAEVARAALAMPIAFVSREEDVLPVAVLGFRPSQNLFVAPDGRWAGTYIPAAFRAYPFVLAKSGNEQFSLCVDEGSGLLDSDIGGEPFFCDDGNPAKAIADTMEFLVKTRHSYDAVTLAAGVLKAHGLLEAWPIKVKDGEQEQDVSGLLRVNEKSLNMLEGDALFALSKAGALALAYAQLLSMQNIHLLSRLSQARVAAQNRVEQSHHQRPYFIDTEKEETFDWNSILSEKSKS